VLAACATSDACRRQHPDLRQKLDRLERDLAAPGRRIEYLDPRSGRPRTGTFTFDLVLGGLHALTYAPERAALLPEVIDRAAAGDFGPLLALAQAAIGDLSGQMTPALHYAVICSEDAPRVTPEERRGLERLRSRALAASLFDVCDDLAEGHPGRRHDAGAQRRAGAAAVRRARPGDAAGRRRDRRGDLAPQPAGRGAGFRAHRVALRLRAAADRRVRRRRGRGGAPRVVHRLPRRDPAQPAVAGPAGTAAVIAVDALVKGFGKRGRVHAVDHVSFTAPDGEITGLLGPNGAGKTTLLRLIAALIVPDAGSARVAGHDVVRDRHEVRRRIGVPPTPALSAADRAREHPHTRCTASPARR
jgi:ABC-type multidrug transport system fused ATPase/permease subunit